MIVMKKSVRMITVMKSRVMTHIRRKMTHIKNRGNTIVIAII